MTKANCADLIVSAIRAIRLNRPNMKQGTAAGVAMHRLWREISEHYGRQEFRLALEYLLSAGTVIATWDTTYVRVSRVGGQVHHDYLWNRRERVHSIPPGMPLEDIGWRRGPRTGKFIKWEGGCKVSRVTIRHFLFYVAADGLAKRALRRDPN